MQNISCNKGRDRKEGASGRSVSMIGAATWTLVTKPGSKSTGGPDLSTSSFGSAGHVHHELSAVTVSRVITYERHSCFTAAHLLPPQWPTTRKQTYARSGYVTTPVTWLAGSRARIQTQFSLQSLRYVPSPTLPLKVSQDTRGSETAWTKEKIHAVRTPAMSTTSLSNGPGSLS